MSKKVMMIFKEDKYVDKKIFALKGEPVSVDEASVNRWVKRGGVVVEKATEKPVEVKAPVVEEVKKKKKRKEEIKED